MPSLSFDPACRCCPRLAAFLDEIGSRYPAYHARPVPPFGDTEARFLIVGLAPGMHGANATGRPFTGDYAGVLLYQTLYEFGFSNRCESRHAADSLRLDDCRITNAVKCLPPQNKPQTEEIRSCNTFLAKEIAGLGAGAVILALGRIAHNATVRALGKKQSAYPFAHGARHALEQGRWLVDSYHCSRYNTQTGRLTREMFQAVFRDVRRLLDGGN